MITSSCLYILCSIEVWYVARKLNHTYLMSNLNTKHMQTVSVYSKWFVVLVCLARSATGFVMVGCIHSFVRIQELFKISRMPLYSTVLHMIYYLIFDIFLIIAVMRLLNKLNVHKESFIIGQEILNETQ
mmetsp:Transcript_9818/g.19349  ORF Transcript_9818/g.19349 Transcript_9818/m.19349 type:complete len:129 (-) Transcript_9818:129-515(-)